MIIPIRCFTCRRPIAHLWEPFLKLHDEGLSIDEALTELGLGERKMCCRTVLITHVDLIDELLKYANNPGEEAQNEKKLAISILQTVNDADDDVKDDVEEDDADKGEESAESVEVDDAEEDNEDAESVEDDVNVDDEDDVDVDDVDDEDVDVEDVVDENSNDVDE
jgi:DNA-directed RNA polymerase subunit N (RpoN/RPB10)